MYILFDLGKTNLRVAGTSDKKKFFGQKILKSPKTLEKAVDLIIEESEKISESKKIEGFAGGVTAVLDKSRGEKTVLLLKKKTGRRALITNDSALVGLGEANFGAGKNFSIVQYITVSSGIGGTRIVDSQIAKSAFGFEPGNQIIDWRKKIKLEDIASGTAIRKKYKKEPKEVLSPKVWRDLCQPLSVGIYNSILHWMPDVVVLGGSMITGNPAIPIKGIEQELKKINKVLPKLPLLKKAALGDFGGLYGALNLLDKNLDFFG